MKHDCFKHKLNWIVLFFLILLSPIAYAQQPATKVTLGIKPDYWSSLKGGVTVGGVIEGKIAKSVGIEVKDKIIALDKNIIGSIFDYRDALNKYSPGDKAKVMLVRNGKTLVFDVKF